jgi:hypothetical protein
LMVNDTRSALLTLKKWMTKKEYDRNLSGFRSHSSDL